MHISLEDNLFINYTKEFLTRTKADKLFNYLNQNLTYNSEKDSMVMIRGKYIKIPRQQVAYGNINTYYEFAGNKVDARYWSDDECGLLLEELRNDIELYTGKKFNFVLVNKYKDGNSYIGYHHDDERNLVPKSSIVGISLGSERDFMFKADEITQGNDTIKINLNHGSLVQINYPTNKFWKHSIPKRANVNSPRISLTFREMKI